MELKNLKRLILILHLATNLLTVNSFNLCYFKIDEEIIMQYDLDEDVIFIKDAMSKIPDHSRVTEFFLVQEFINWNLSLISKNLGIALKN